MCLKGHYQESEKIALRMREKLFANQISDKDLISIICKELIQLNKNNF